MLKAQNITKIYDGVTVLDNLNLEIKSGEFVALLGKSGSGKSTLLNILGTLETPDGGDIFLDDINLKNLSANESAKLRNQTFGFVFQSFYLEPTYSVSKNIEIPLLIAKLSKAERLSRVNTVLKKVGLENKLNTKSAVLSGGEKQRVAIARAIANNPKIIFADEPTGNLDTANGKVVIELLRDLANQGITILLVTHNLEDAKSADRVLEIVDGKLKC